MVYLTVELGTSMSVLILGILFLSGLAAGFIDSIAGGGGLISLPMLLTVGVPPQVALGTNKLQGTFGVLTSSFHFIRRGKVNLRDCRVGIVATFLGAVAGAVFVQRLDPAFIGRIVPFLLLLVLVYTVFTKNLGVEDQRPKMASIPFFVLFGLLLGFYDGFFGPGTGSFWTALLLFALGYNMTKAIGVTRVMNLTSNVVALAVFIIGGNVNIAAGLVMAAGQVIGARIGANMAITRGVAFIRPVFIAVVMVTVLRLFYLNYRVS